MDGHRPPPQRVNMARFREDLPLKPAWTRLSRSAQRPVRWWLPRLSLLPPSFISLFLSSLRPPQGGYFTAHRLQRGNSHSHGREINVWAIPFFSFSLWCEGHSDVPIFAGGFGYLCRVVTFNPITTHRPWCWPTQTFSVWLTDGWLFQQSFISPH